MAIEAIRREALSERLVHNARVELELASQKVQTAIINFIEYPAASWRPASTKYSWYFEHWLDWQFQKATSRFRKKAQKY